MELKLRRDLEGSIGSQNYLCTIIWENGAFFMDEPKDAGGEDLGPNPYSLLMASLAGCTLATLKMYIDRKEWELINFSVSLNFYQTINEETKEFTTHITRKIKFNQAVSEEQEKKLLLIAKKCPVSKILENKIEIDTELLQKN